MAKLKILPLLIVLTLAACGKTGLTPDTTVNAPRGLGIQGFDPVAYHADKKAKPGTTQFQTAYQGVVYQFTNAQNKQAFDANPQSYLPAYGGYCAYAMSNGDIVDINPRNWTVINGQLYLNANIFAQGLFAINTDKKIREANGHWNTLISSAANRAE